MTDKAITPQERGDIMIKELNVLLANPPLAKVVALYCVNQMIYSLYRTATESNVGMREYYLEVKRYLETIVVNG